MRETQPQAMPESTKKPDTERELLLKAKALAESKRSPPKGGIAVRLELAGDYVECPACKGHYRALQDSGTCRSCEDSAAQNKAKSDRKRSKLIEVLGGEYPLNEFRIEKCKMVRGNREAVTFAKVFNHTTQNAYLSGWAGSGKSHLAYGMAIEAFLATEITLEILTTEQLSRRVTGNNFDRKSETIKQLIDADVLVLDDLCRKKETENTIDAICEIMDYRKYAYRNGLILTGNYKLDDLAGKLGDDRLPSRIAGMCKSNIFKVEPVSESGNKIDWRVA